MSKKVIYSKHIEKGRFYHIHEGSKTGHPGMVYWKNDKRNLYLALTTDTSEGEHRLPLKVPTQQGAKKSYVQTRPLLAKRKDFGGVRLNLKFSKIDKKLLKDLSRNQFRESLSIKHKDRYFIKHLKKKPRY